MAGHKRLGHDTSGRTLVRRGWLLGLLALGLGLPGIGAIAANPNVSDANAAVSNTAVSNTLASEVAATTTVVATPARWADGVYLYGESPEPEQLGRAYLVFEVTQGAVIGAFYMPSSEFDCTYGRFQADQLALTVIDSYEKGRHPYTIALEPATPIAAQDPRAGGLNLQGFYPIATVSANDLRLLAACKSHYPATERMP